MMSDFTELKNMRARGELSVQEFLEMVRALRTEDSRTEEPAEEVRDGESEEEPDVVPAASGRPPSVVHVEAQEDGTPNGQENASAAPSSAASHSGQSVSSSTAGGTNTTSRSSSTTSSNKQVQAKPFLPGEKLIHTIYGDVTFVRYGNSLDFLNDGRCRISYQRVKRGCKNKMETWNSWSLPSILSRPMPSESTDGEGSSTCRQAESGAADDTDDEVVITRLDKVGPKPTLAGIERDRKLPQKRKSEGKLGVQHGEHKTKASKIPAHQRVSEFPEESLTVSAGEVMCRACSRSLFNKHSTIDGHVKGAKHIRNLADWNARGGEDIQVKHRLVEYYKSHPNEVCSSLDGDTLLFRYRLTECLLHAGIALGKADFLRPLLERCGQSMTAATHLKVLVPKIEEDELSRIRHEVKGQYVSLVFDGTTRVGEATAMVMRWCNSNFSVVQRLVMLTTTLKHMDAKEMGRLLTEHVMLELKTRSDQVVCMTRDSCSTNGLASRRMRILLTSAEDILCVCHTLNHVGDHFQLPQLDPFLTSWIGLIYSSPTAKAIWKQLLGINASVVGYSAVRWYAKAEIVMQIAQNFPLISEALTAFEEKGVGQAHRTRLRELYDQHHDHIELQCAAILDMRPVVATTYELEGDRLEILLAYERIEALRQLGRTIESKGPLPNVDALLQKRIQVGIGTKIRKEWPGQGMFDGEVVDEFDDLVSTLYPDGREVRGFQVCQQLPPASVYLLHVSHRPLIHRNIRNIALR